MESILTSIKKLLGIQKEYEHFDDDIIIFINTAFSSLNQLGVGPSEGFAIRDENVTWEDYIGDDPRLESVKSYVYLKVKLLFDPPSSSSIIEAYNRAISETEWRLNITVDNTTEGDK